MPLQRPADALLAHLHLAPEAPTLDYLHRLIAAHQRRVPFETLTKLIDYEPGLARGDFLPPLDEYVTRIVRRGGGGLCWTLARGFQVLLADLGFDAALMVMEPGHCCVRVELPEGPQYGDVGYAAPILQAYPLFESFTLDTHREQFVYRFGDDGIVVARQPGPSKRLDPTPRRLDELRARVDAANDWSAPQSFLRRLAYARVGRRRVHELSRRHAQALPRRRRRNHRAHPADYHRQFAESALPVRLTPMAPRDSRGGSVRASHWLTPGQDDESFCVCASPRDAGADRLQRCSCRSAAATPEHRHGPDHGVWPVVWRVHGQPVGQVLLLEPNNPRAMGGLAVALYLPVDNGFIGGPGIRKQRLVEAVDLAIRAKEIDPKVVDSYLVLGLYKPGLSI